MSLQDPSPPPTRLPHGVSPWQADCAARLHCQHQQRAHQLPAFMVTLRRVVCKEQSSTRERVGNSGRTNRPTQAPERPIALYLASEKL